MDDYNFRHENMATYWLSWFDPGAEEIITNRTSTAVGVSMERFVPQSGAAASACRRPCSNRVAEDRCCDAIFLPSIYFTNADAFPEDRATGYSIDTTANWAVVWETTVHGLFYQAHNGPALGIIPVPCTHQLQYPHMHSIRRACASGAAPTAPGAQ